MNGAKDSLLSAVRTYSGGQLRDLWLFDERHHEALYLREDVREKVADVAVEKHIDNERYGYITRETYNQLNYAEYRYTIRGFDQYEQFRTFVADNGLRVGVFASFDRQPEGYNFARLQERLDDVVARYSPEEFVPESDGSEQY